MCCGFLYCDGQCGIQLFYFFCMVVNVCVVVGQGLLGQEGLVFGLFYLCVDVVVDGGYCDYQEGCYLGIGEDVFGCCCGDECFDLQCGQVGQGDDVYQVGQVLGIQFEYVKVEYQGDYDVLEVVEVVVGEGCEQ